MIVRHLPSGQEVEVLDFTGDELVLISPPGQYENARLVPIGELDPNPRLEAWRVGWVPWTHRLGPPRHHEDATA